MLTVNDGLIETAEAAGYTLEVDGRWSDEEDLSPILFDFDDAVVTVNHPMGERGVKALGWFRLVRGNGPDLISDYTTSIRDWIAPVLDFAKSIGGES